MATATKSDETGTNLPVPLKEIHSGLVKMTDQFQAALPAHIPVERFIRVAMLAIQKNPKLAACTRTSLFLACSAAANDGLLPDGLEGAIVPYGEDAEGRGRSDVARWLPMIYGLRKKVRNSGVLRDWNAQVVFEGDEFAYQLGDEPFIHHRPAMRGGRQRPVKAAYSIAVYPDGSKSREVMNIDQIEDIRRLSKAKKGPWSNPVFYPEMCRKTVARLHSKQLPMSTDLDTLMRRDDDLYDFAGAREEGRKVQRPGSAAGVLAMFAKGADPPIDDVPAPEGDDDTPSKPPAADALAPAPEEKPFGAFPDDKAPATVAEYEAYAIAVIDAATNANDLARWFGDQSQINLRNKCGLVSENYRPLHERTKQKVNLLRQSG